MGYNYEHGKKISEFTPIIGQKWVQQGINNKYLNTIFGLIDNGDKALSEEEFDLFQRLLQKADGINSRKFNKIAEDSELAAVIKQIQNGEIDIDELRKTPSEFIDRELYTKEALEKRYPESDYEITKVDAQRIRIFNKKTNKKVLEVYIAPKNYFDDTSVLTYYDEDGHAIKDVMYNSQTDKLKAYQFAGEDRHDVLPEALYADITSKKLGIIPTTGEDFEKHLDELNKYNIEEVLAQYENLSDNSLICDIMTERGLSAKKRATLAKKVIDVYIESRKSKVGNIDGFKEKFYELIDAERDGWSSMNGKKVDNLMHQLEDTQVEFQTRNFYLEVKDKPDGKISKDFYQGAAGDCWLLAAIKSIMQNPATAKLLNDQISVDKNGNVTVNLVNVGKSYTFTKEEIQKANKFSTGDIDVRALEMAVDKYLHENSKTTQNLLKYLNGKNDIGIDDGGYSGCAYEILLGSGGAIISKRIIFTKAIIDDYVKNGDYLVTVSAGGSLGEKSDFEVQDDLGRNHKLSSRHAYSVISTDDTYVYLVNPWDTSRTLSVPIDKFVDFFRSVEVCSINEVLKNIAKKYNFGEDVKISDDGKVFIPYKSTTITKQDGEMKTQAQLTDKQIQQIKNRAVKKYGKDYSVKINKKGDILLTPLRA